MEEIPGPTDHQEAPLVEFVDQTAAASSSPVALLPAPVPVGPPAEPGHHTGGMWCGRANKKARAPIWGGAGVGIGMLRGAGKFLS